MKRVRWFRAKLPYSLRTFTGKIAGTPLRIDGEMGFRTERFRNDSLEAIYYERYAWTEHLIDPFGRESSLERSGYKSLRFIFSKNYPELELIDAPRGLTSFLSRVAEITDFEATIEPIEVDVLAWSAAIQKSCNKGFRVAGITVSNLSVEESVTGRLTIMSRQKDVQGAASRLLARRSYSVDKVQIMLRGDSIEGSLVLAADGTVRSDQELDLDIIRIVRDALPKAGGLRL